MAADQSLVRVSVIIPCHGGVDLTRACVRSLLGQCGVADLEILVVDNDSDDATRELDRMDGRVRVLRLPENRGFAGGVNAGLHAAQHELLLALNNDTQAAPNLLERLGTALRTHPRAALVAPVSNHVKGEARVAVGNLGREPDGCHAIAQALAGEHRDRVQDVTTLSGLCLMMHRDTWRRVGDFDERYGHGNYEDDDYSLRARLHGGRLLIVRDAFLHHEGHATFRALGLDLGQELHRRRAQFLARWREDPAGAAVVADLLGDRMAAAERAEAAARAYPLWPDADWLRGLAAEARGAHAQAARHYAAFLDQCPHHAEAALRLALVGLQQGDRAAALRRLWQTVQEEFVTRELAVSMLRRCGETLRELGDGEPAIRCFQAASDLVTDDADLQNWLGVALMEAGRHAEAIVPLQRACAVGLPLAHTNLGICWYRRGDLRRAWTHFRKAIELAPDDERAQQNLRELHRALAGVGAS